MRERGGVELDFRSWMDGLGAELFSAAVSVDTAFVSVFPTTVPRLSCGVHRLLSLASCPPAVYPLL